VSNGLAPRPELPPEEMAAVLAAAELLLTSVPAPVEVDDVPVWRFSGRWFAAHPFSSLRRP